MILKEYTDKDTENKNRTFVQIKCDVCDSVFSRQKRFVKTHTCSERCRNISSGRTLAINCGYCNKTFDIARSKRLETNYCSRYCKESVDVNSYRQKALRQFGEKCQRCGY